MNSFGEQLKQLRLAAGLTQQDLADELGISASAIGMYEQGRREPDRVTLLVMSHYFGVSCDYLLGFPQSRDVRDMIDGMRHQVRAAEGMMFNGVPIDPEDTDKLFDAMLVAASILFNESQKSHDRENQSRS